MGALKDLYQMIWKELGGSRAFSDASEPLSRENLRREIARHGVAKEVNNLACMLLLNPRQKGSLPLYKESDEAAPIDDLELIVKNNVTAKKYVKTIKECILDLDELSAGADQAETEALHKDELSVAVLNLLHRQAAQVLVLSGADEKNQLELFLKQPKNFVRSVLLSGDRAPFAFDGVEFAKDLSSVDSDCREFIRKSHLEKKHNAVRKEDERFNRDALKIGRVIRKLDRALIEAKGKKRETLESKKARAEELLAKSTMLRRSALRDAFRAGDISDYYYCERGEQLQNSIFTHVPEMFEADALKDKEGYLKEHDLQDLSKEEREDVCNLARKKTEADKELYFKKKFLTNRKLARSNRYMISEMFLIKERFYRGLAEENGLYEDTPKTGEAIGNGETETAMRQNPPTEEKTRSVKK